MFSIGKSMETEKVRLYENTELTVPSIEAQQNAVDALLNIGLRNIYEILQEGEEANKIKAYNSLISHARLIEMRRMNETEDTRMIMDDPDLVLIEDDA